MYGPINTMAKAFAMAVRSNIYHYRFARSASSIRKTIVRGHFAPLSTIALLAPL